MSNNFLLITTALEHTWLKNRNFSRIFLTEACRLFSRKIEWEHLKCNIVPYHWNDRRKLKTDYNYLKIFYEQILIPISENLNRINGTNESVEYWRIIIGPWLINYISIIFDRWEMISRAFADGKNITTADLPENHEFIVAKDFDDFIRIMQTDEWNFQIYHRIISNRFNNKVTFHQIEGFTTKIHQEYNKNIYKQHLKHKVLDKLDKFFKLFNINPKVFIYQGYFPQKSLTKLNFALKQFQRLYLKDFSFTFSSTYDYRYRSEFSFEKSDSEFEVFFLENIFLDMPIAYLEAYKEIKEFIRNIPLKPEKILTANAYWGEDIFKFWLGLQKNNKSKIIISHHGGSLPPMLDTFSHEEDIADHVVTWFKPYHPKHIQLPPNKLCGITSKNNKGRNCSLIGFESPRFGYRACSVPITNRAIDCFNQQISFCEALNPEIKCFLKVRPYPDMGWQTKLRFIETLGASKIDSNSYNEFLINSRLLVCTYPATTFSESMFSGKPTILLYIPEFNETIEMASELIDILVKAKIIFNDSLEAAKHVNQHWDNLEVWWQTNEVLFARKQFNEFAMNIDKRWLGKWTSFLKNV